MILNRRAFVGTVSSAFVVPTFSFGATVERPAAVVQIYNQLNAERQSKGLNGLTVDPRLEQAAAVFANELEQRQYGRVKFKAHTLGAAYNLKSRARKAGYRVKRIGEAVGYFPSPERAFNGWMGSRAHRAILMDRRMKNMGLSKVGNVYVYVAGRSK